MTKSAKTKATATKGATPNDAAKGKQTSPAAPTKVKHIVTEEDLVNNPDLATKGVKLGDEIEIDAPVKPVEPKGNAGAKEDKKAKSLAEKMEPYTETYPQVKVFHITSDGQVFLDDNKADANAHELTLGGVVTIYNV